MSQTQSNHSIGFIAAGVVCCLLALGAQELAKRHAVERVSTLQVLDKAVQSFEQASAASKAQTTLETQTAAHKALETKVERARKHVVEERFDPQTGRLVSRRTEREDTRIRVAVSSETATAASRASQTVEQVTASSSGKTEHSTETTQTVTEKPAASVQRGIGVGTIATFAGAGPAMSYQLVSAGPVGLDVSVGALTLSGVSPRAGVFVTGEVSEHLTVGLGAVAAPAGAEPVAYPLVPFLVEFAPGATLQYRF